MYGYMCVYIYLYINIRNKNFSILLYYKNKKTFFHISVAILKKTLTYNILNLHLYVSLIWMSSMNKYIMLKFLIVDVQSDVTTVKYKKKYLFVYLGTIGVVV